MSLGSNGLLSYIIKLLSGKCLCFGILQSDPYHDGWLCLMPSDQRLLRIDCKILSSKLLCSFRQLDLQTDWPQQYSWIANYCLRYKYYVLESDFLVCCQCFVVIHWYCD